MTQVAPAAGRRERRRVANHQRLLEAARRLMARAGYERASIAAIAEEADLGFGTFYSHFASKEAVFRELIDAAAAARYAAMESAIEGLEDRAERVAVGSAMLVALAGREIELTRFLLEARRAGENPGEEVVLAQLRAGVDAGCAEGRFRVADAGAAVAAVAGCVRGLVAAVAARRLSPTSATGAAAELPLRLLGLDPEEAERLGRRAAGVAAARLGAHSGSLRAF